MTIPKKYSFFIFLSVLLVIFIVLLFLYSKVSQNSNRISISKPSFSVDGQHIIVGLGNTEAYRGICCISKDGKILKRLTFPKTGKWDRDPVYSPDGLKVVFLRRDFGKSIGNLYMINADGSGETQLTHGEFLDENPVFSKDGKTIYFLRTGPPFRNDSWPSIPSYNIYSVKVSDMSLQKETQEDFVPLEGPYLSPDNKTMLLGGHKFHEPPWQMLAFNFSDRSYYPIKPEFGNYLNEKGPYVHMNDPSYSPDGKNIVFVASSSKKPNVTRAEDSLFIMDAETKIAKRLVDVNSSSTTWPSFSPDGKEIIFYSGWVYEDDKLWIVNSDGSNLREIKIKFNKAK
jgi:Tol biopolymer transport system component